MGKAKKLKPSQAAKKVPLEQDIEDAKFTKPKNRNKIRLRKDDDEQVRPLLPCKEYRFTIHIFSMSIPIYHKKFYLLLEYNNGN